LFPEKGISSEKEQGPIKRIEKKQKKKHWKEKKGRNSENEGPTRFRTGPRRGGKDPDAGKRKKGLGGGGGKGVVKPLRRGKRTGAKPLKHVRK